MPKLDHRTALHLCADNLGHVPTRAEYSRWRQRLDSPRSVASDQCIGRGKKWVQVLVDANLEPRQHRLSDTDIWATIATARRTLGNATKGDYDRWRYRTTPKPPSSTTLTNRTGKGWSELFPG